MCDPAKELENAGKDVSKWGEQFDHTLGVSAVSREATNAAAAIGSTVEAIGKDPRKLAAVGIMIAFPGAAASVGNYLLAGLPAGVAATLGPTGAAILGQTAINAATNGGDVKSAVTSALVSQGAPELTKYVANSYATEGVSKAITDWAAKATVDTGIATALGKDPTSALLFSGAKAATDAVMSMTGVSNTMSMLPKEAQSALKAAITAKMMNIDPSKALAQDLVNQAIGSAQNMAKAQWYTKSNNLPPLTEEQLNRVPPPDPKQSDYDNSRDFDSSIKNIVNDAKAQKEGWSDDQEKFDAAQQGISDPKEYATKKFVAYGDIFGTGVQGARYLDGRVRTEGDDGPRAPTAEEAVALARTYKFNKEEIPQIILDALPKEGAPTSKEETKDVVKTLTDAGLHDDLADSVDLNKIVDTEKISAKPTLNEAMDAGKAGDKLAQINMMRDIVGLPKYNSIEEYNAEQRKHGGEEIEITDQKSPSGKETIVSNENTDANNPASDQRLSEAIDKGKSGDLLGQINLQRQIVGLPPYASIDEFNATKEGQNLIKDQEEDGLDSATSVAESDVVQTKPAADNRLTEAINKGKSGDLLGQINLQREIVGLAPFASIDEFYATKEGKNLLEDKEDSGTSNVVDDLTKAGLHDDLDTTDLTKVVGGSDTTPPPDERLTEAIEKGKSGDLLGQINQMREIVGLPKFDSIEDYEAFEEAEQAKRVSEFGKDLTGGGNQNLGEVDVNTPIYSEDSTGTGAYKYDQKSGTYTFTSDDGSTLTLDGDGNIVGSTETTDTPWTGITDTKTGKLKLPSLPGGKLPDVKPPTKKITDTTKTTTTGTGNTAVTTGSSTVVSTGSGTAVQTGGGLNMAALMAIMGGMGGNQQAQQAQVETYDPGKGFDYFDWESDPFGSKTKDKTNPTGQPKMAGGGSIDELLEILRRSGI